MNNGLNFYHLSDGNITQKEIIELAKLYDKDPEEFQRDFVAALADLKYSQNEIESTISKNNLKLFPDHRVRIGEFGLNGEFDNYFLCHDDADLCVKYDISDIALVTGFGPTNSPTAGTLSIIFRLLNIQKISGIYCHVIISDLGALNSRRKPIMELLNNTARFNKFITALGFDHNRGELRSHNNLDMFRTASIVSSVLSLGDFQDNKEATEGMYERLKIVGNDFSSLVDKNFTVADILLPIIRDQKKLVLVSAGLEEQYYSLLSRKVIRCLQECQGLSDFVNGSPKVAAVYGRIIEGMFPYVKMSKSIPDSAINIGSTVAEIERKILNCGEINEHVIMQMIELASNWNLADINLAQRSFVNRKEDSRNWFKTKREYLNSFLKIKKIWDSSTQELGSVRENIYKQNYDPIKN